jgi:hypothetical protein
MKPRRLLWTALIVGAALRLVALGLYYHAPLSPGGDDRQYQALASSLRAGEGFVLNGEVSAYRAPLYPLFIAAVQTKSGTSAPGPVRAAQCALGILLIIMLFDLGCRLHSAEAGGWAALLGAIHPELVLLQNSLYLEAVYALLVLWVAIRLAAWHTRPGRRELAYLGLTLGLSLCARSFLALVPAAVLTVRLFQAPTRRWLQECAILALCVSLPLLPWLVRNAVRFNRVIPFEAGVAGPVLFYASEGFVYAPANEAGVEPMRTMYATLHHSEWDEYATSRAIQTIIQAPYAYAVSTLQRVGALWSDAYVPYLLHAHPKWSSWLERGRHWEYLRTAERALRCVLILLAGLGLVLGARWRLWPIVGLVLYFSFYALGTVFPRFLAPAAPLICALAGAGIATLRNATANKSTAPSPAAQ